MNTNLSSMPTSNSNIFRKARILIVDDEHPIREVLSATLRDEGHEVFTASDGDSGLKKMHEVQPEIVFLDIWMPGSLDGIEVLNRARQEFPAIDFVMISGHGTIETAVKATKLGAWDFIEKPLSMDKITIAISNILQFQSERQEKTALLNKLRKSIALIGENPKIMALKQFIAKVSPINHHLLLRGENGSGKELVAKNVHYLSARASRPFIEINCADLSDDLVEYELLGFEKGAFAGAERTQKGKLELANGGTIFLDDIAQLSAKAQEVLLNLLVENRFARVGGAELIACDIRFVFATAKDLEQLAKDGKFRLDLLHRIQMFPFTVPSLREHKEDIPALVYHFSDISAKEGGFQKKIFSDAAISAMQNHSWLGNVRELRNFIERVYIMTPSDFVDLPDIQAAGLAVQQSSTDTSGPQLDYSTFREARASFEKEYLMKKISENNGNISKTAESIGLERSYLHRKIKAFGIDVVKSAEEQL